ncbi:hypothetical protein KIW84_070987 [Lathyrus oleraceus]|uniref:Aminotransferase-like plant mobile domain-containing protein n=1 Tax=Pisum sativum TaxID=3888 RepID=A0A9D4VH53_PEA|nr:hypothetical protein KIW84_070987 [Pisum sativum]
MMTPTLFDVAAIGGLPPTGETFDPYQDCENLIDLNVKNASFSTYINLYHADGEEVSDIEHIEFLGLWLSKFFFCCKSLQVAKRFLTLANQLHIGRRVCLSELLLASLYESLGSASAKLKEYETGTNLLLSGPYWLLQLWLNATFKSFLPTRGNVEENAPEIINRSIEGTRLLRLTPTDDVDNLQTSLTKYTLMLSKRHHFLPSMAPFASRTHGPSLFTTSLEDAVKNANTEIEDIWRAFLLPREATKSGERARRKSKRTRVEEGRSLKLKDCRINSVLIFRTCSFLRNWNRRSGSPPTAENAENSAFCFVLAQEQLSVLR